MKLRIYVAGPYSAPTSEARLFNTNSAIDAGIAILRRGHIPFIPHLTHFVDQRAHATKTVITYEEYIEWDLAWLEGCDALLFLGASRGADIELAAAEHRHLQIFRSVEEIPDLAADRGAEKKR